MNKRQLIDDIRTINTSAAPQFLAQFNETALEQYLDHLKASRRKHAVISRVIRPAAPLQTTNLSVAAPARAA
jgi:hypothetical protein